MTRDEIQELIEYLEKNYHVKCIYTTRDDDFWGKIETLTVIPCLKLHFGDMQINKEIITNKLDKLDLIRF